MAKKEINLKLNADTSQANAAIQETAGEIKDIGTSSEESLAQADQLTGGLITNFKAVGQTILGAVKTLRTLKGALIASGIGAFALAVVAVGQAFTNSEAGQNRFAKIMSQIGVVTGNVIDILANLGEAILDVGNIITGIFTGNAKEAFDSFKQNISEAVEGVQNFGEETRKEIKIAGDLADARAAADKIERQLIVDRAKADRDRAELLEKAVDKENFSTQERIGFLQAASALEEEITDKEIQLAQTRLDVKRQENSLSESTKEDLQEEAQLEADLILLKQAQLSKQKEVTSQTIALINEEKAAQKAKDDKAKADRDKDLAEREAFRIAEREALAIDEDAKTELLVMKEQERFDKLIEQAKKFDQDTVALEEAKAASIAKIQQDAQAKIDQAEQAKQAAADAARAKELADQEALETMKLQITQNALATGAMLAGQGSAFGKALAIANALISVKEGATNALKDVPFPFNLVAAATVIGTGFAQIKDIIATDTPKPPPQLISGAAGSSPVAMSGAQLTAPAFNVVGASASNQLAEALGQNQGQPVQAFVVANDVTTAQSLDRNIVSEAGI